MARPVAIEHLAGHVGALVERASRGASVTITRAGRPVATLGPVSAAPLAAEALLERWRGLPVGVPDAARRDLDAVLEPSP
jgi:prevent-host-death family protein